jgi:hypothetical protein
MSRTGGTLSQLVQKAKTPSILQASLPAFSVDIPQGAQGSAREATQSYSFVVSYPEPVHGYVNTKTIHLRESADAIVPSVTTLEENDYSEAQILGASRDFLHVSFAPSVSGSATEEERTKTFEGWTTWAEIVPDMSAIVLDAETGRVVARLPLDQKFLASTQYSSDGSRAVFYSPGESSTASIYEVRTSGYTLSRSLRLAQDSYLESVFYVATGNQLHAIIRAGNSADKKLTLVRINDDGSTNNLMEFEVANVGFALSPDARTGFVIHQGEAPSYQFKITVVDLQTLSIRNSFTLESGDGFQSLHMDNFVTNWDGSELYVRLSNAADAISVMDTRTGKSVRELPGNLSAHSWATFRRGALAGDSVLVKYCDTGEDEVKGCWNRIWIGDNGRSNVERDIEYAVEAGGESFAVNSKGTRLFKLDNKNRVRKSFMIERPERREGAVNGNSLSVFGLSASPDGQRIVMFVGLEHGC